MFSLVFGFKFFATIQQIADLPLRKNFGLIHCQLAIKWKITVIWYVKVARSRI